MKRKLFFILFPELRLCRTDQREAVPVGDVEAGCGLRGDEVPVEAALVEAQKGPSRKLLAHQRAPARDGPGIEPPLGRLILLRALCAVEAVVLVRREVQCHCSFVRKEIPI